jgi:NADH-quinone oxidoreductase subunit F
MSEPIREKPLTKNISPSETPFDLKQYESAGGYQAVRKAMTEMAPEEVTGVVKEANLRGRGGAGFPTGMKWSFVPMGDRAPERKYLVANADEMEPGTFKDRLLLEGDPHQFIEGMILAAYAIQADVAYIFLRWAYKKAEALLRKSITEAYDAGYLGKNILGSGYNLELYLHTSAGRYICGEETALMNALEGKRPIPRTKPPFPQTSGLWGKPTIVQNVETLCNVPHIVANGAEWYKSLSYSGNGGTKLFGASGKIKRPAIWELPLGTPMRELLEEHAGGMQDGLKFRGVLPGGASTDFLVEEHLDLPMDYEPVMEAGSRLGTGTMVILDDKTCPVGMIRNLELFFTRESCGFCTPCRDGIPWTHRLLDAIELGDGKSEDIDNLEFIVNTITRMLGRTFCAFAPGAVEPLQSGLKYFRDDFEQHIGEKRCPYAS